MSSAVSRLLLLIPLGFLTFYGLSAGELYRTESLRAVIGAETLRGGRWLVPTLYGEPYVTKPPGMYVAIALASWPGGKVTEWSARLPSALAATFTTVLFFWFFRRQLGPTAGLVAALTLPMSLMWLDKTPSAEIDMLQLAWVAGALLFFYRGLEEEDRGSARWWLVALLFVAGGVLTKWTAAAFFYGTVIPLLWWRGRLRVLWSRPHLLPAVLAGGLCVAWAAAVVYQVGWPAFYEKVSREALMHLSPAHTYRPPGYHHRPPHWLEVLIHPFRVWGAALPLSAFAVAALWPGFRRRWDERGQHLLQFFHCWLWPNLIFWSLVPEHGVRHCLPLYPALAGLAIMTWTGWLTDRLTWPFRRLAPGVVLAGLLAAWVGAKIGFVHGVIPARAGSREPREKGEALAALVPADRTLYLFRVKDEGIMFYYGGPVRRLADPGQLPSSAEPLYCILEEEEWRHWPVDSAETVWSLTDEQGASLRLVKTRR